MCVYIYIYYNHPEVDRTWNLQHDSHLSLLFVLCLLQDDYIDRHTHTHTYISSSLDCSDNMKPRYSQSFSAGAAKGAEGSGLLERTAMSHVGINRDIPDIRYSVANSRTILKRWKNTTIWFGFSYFVSKMGLLVHVHHRLFHAFFSIPLSKLRDESLKISRLVIEQGMNHCNHRFQWQWITVILSS